MKIIFGLMLAAGLVGCDTAPRVHPYENLRLVSVNLADSHTEETTSFLKTGTEKQAIEKAQSVIAGQLKDPASAQFRNVTIKPYGSGKVICGEVNGKNSYGAYSGFTRFMSGVSGGTIYSDNRDAELNKFANSGLVAACG